MPLDNSDFDDLIGAAPDRPQKGQGRSLTVAIGSRTSDTRPRTKRLTWDEARISRIETRLTAEADAFYRRIGMDGTVASMAAFIGAKEAVNV